MHGEERQQQDVGLSPAHARAWLCDRSSFWVPDLGDPEGSSGCERKSGRFEIIQAADDDCSSRPPWPIAAIDALEGWKA